VSLNYSHFLALKWLNDKREMCFGPCRCLKARYLIFLIRIYLHATALYWPRERERDDGSWTRARGEKCGSCVMIMKSRVRWNGRNFNYLVIRNWSLQVHSSDRIHFQFYHIRYACWSCKKSVLSRMPFYCLIEGAYRNIDTSSATVFM
jgi:hypothetical protein